MGKSFCLRLPNSQDAEDNACVCVCVCLCAGNGVLALLNVPVQTQYHAQSKQKSIKEEDLMIQDAFTIIFDVLGKLCSVCDL